MTATETQPGATDAVRVDCVSITPEAGPDALSVQPAAGAASAQGWCPSCRGFGELFYLPEVDRGARARPSC